MTPRLRNPLLWELFCTGQAWLQDGRVVVQLRLLK